MNWFERNYPWVMLTLAVVTAYAIVGFVGVSGVALLAGAAGGASIGALLADAAIALGVTAMLIAVELTLAVGFVVSVVRRASFPTSDRLATLFSRLELLVPSLRELALSRRFEPSLEEREQAIKHRYVDGELTETEFEREMADLLAEAEPRPGPADPLDAIDSKGEDREPVGESPSTDPISSENYRDFERE